MLVQIVFCKHDIVGMGTAWYGMGTAWYGMGTPWYGMSKAQCVKQ